MMAAAAMGAASLSSFVAVTYHFVGPALQVTEDPQPTRGLRACFHGGDACAVAEVPWSTMLVKQAKGPVVQQRALLACLHQGDSCAVAIIDPSATIDLETIHELVVLVEQAKQAMAMLRGAADLKRVQHEWDALEGGSFCMAEDAPEDEGPNVEVGVKDKENVHGNDNGNNDNHNDDDEDCGAEPAIGLGSGEVAVRVRVMSARVQSTTLPWLREGRERATRFLAVTIVRAYFFFWSSVGVAHLLMANSDARAGMLAACTLAWLAFRVVKRRREAAVQVEKRQREAAAQLEKRLREMSARVDDVEAVMSARLDSVETSNHCLKQHLFIAHREAAESERKMDILRESLAGEIRCRKAAVQEQRQRVDLLQSLLRERNERPGARAEGERKEESKEERQVMLERMEVVRRKLAVLERLERAGADNEAFRLQRSAVRAKVEELVLQTLQHGINPSDLRPAAGVNRA